MNGFYIKKISVVGNKKKSEVEFSLGLNVITGPSNTGKSFLFQCIDYMFGREVIKDIKELVGYTDIFLEIINNNTYYTLKRKIKEKNIFVCHGKIDDWNDDNAERKNLKHSPKDNNISTFLLGLIGIPSSIKVQKNQNGENQALTFRSLSEWFIIDENTMISESELLFGEYKNPTPEQSTLLYVLDGNIYDVTKKIEKDEVIKARISGKLEVLEINLENNRRRQEELKNLVNINDFILNEDKLREYKNELFELEGRINDLNLNIIQLNKNYEEIIESINLKQQQLNKFDKLKKQYSIDLQRLIFIKENSEKLVNLKSYVCPLCGNQISNELDEDVISSCLAESDNIRINLHDLEELSIEIENEKIKSEEKVEVIANKISEMKVSVTEHYKKIKPLKLSIDEYIKRKQVEIDLENLKVAEVRLAEDIDYRKENYKNTKSNKIKPADEPVTERRKMFIEFLIKLFNEVDDSISKIELTKNLLDIMINGVDRKANGKGYRAFYKSLYFYAMIVFKLQDDNYSKFLLLDSPLTSFKEGDLKNEEITKDLQYNFIEKLAERDDIQVIVFENKEIPNALKDKVNLIEFTRNQKFGRYGFLK